jgi:hypothetical protein
VVPAPDPLTQPYWDAAAERRLIVQRCLACGHHQHYPRGHCTRCWRTELDWTESSGRGTVHSFTVVRRTREPGFADAVPYVYALIDLEEGARLAANVVELEAEDVQVGMPVRVAFRRRGPVSLPLFAPDGRRSAR